MEPRARAGRHKQNLNFGDDLAVLLYGAGNPAHPDYAHPLADGSSERYLENLSSSSINKTNPPSAQIKTISVHKESTTLPNPFPETLRVLDEIVTDFVIETSHAALQVASYAGRAKLKYTDFEFAMRRDRRKLGRMQERMNRGKQIKEARKVTGAADTGDLGQMVDLRKMGVKELQDLGDIVGEEGTGKGRGKGRGRRKKRNADEADLTADMAVRGGQEGDDGGGEDLGDLDVDLDNDLEGDEDNGDRHRHKKPRSEH